MADHTATKIKEFSAALIGLGGLGCPALISLIENWPKTYKLNLCVIDADKVSLSNLNRQVLFSSKDIDKTKIKSGESGLKKSFGALPENITLNYKSEFVKPSQLNHYLGQCDLIFDCTDDVSLKLALNRYAVVNRKILLYAGVQGFEGTVLLVKPNSPCINCAFGGFTAEETCELGGACRTGGVLGSIAGLTGIKQVSELLSHLENPESSNSAILHLISLSGTRSIPIRINPDCLNRCSEQTRKLVDLSSFNCPETFLYTKLALEKLDEFLKEGGEIEFKFALLSDLENVYESLKDEGDFKTSKIAFEDIKEFRLLLAL